MSQTGKVVILGTLAASGLLVGAMQFASGHDLASGLPVQAASQPQTASVVDNVNRANKTDRAAALVDSTRTQTVSIKLAAFADTSFLLRLPLTGAATPGRQVAPPQGSQIITTETERREAKRPVACEPSVSVLTEIAKRLQPGRCIT
ncbi:hypothetical protein HL667_08220 [Bradyrhizobium sp. 83012]|uniref:Uncharacterized protein n=1 Tax=Bradyrhizobium aeschynomenes TaxID=2734909 RepID=A0ABX2CCH5_9BRAD|nr:hypothetical protein [Bradyrhizobium aeschynomenes]NPU13975.1 hypothetical protein [Bradyrhizobium aeschynomenes]NPU64974.1 hypothetical protein [Bradyrhizobium aeschynomenes]